MPAADNRSVRDLPRRPLKARGPGHAPHLRPRPVKHHEPPEIDGFLAALAVGPGLIPTPEDWMPLIWGESEPPFADLDETWQVVDAVLSRVTDVYQQLREDPGADRPVFRVTDDGAEIAAEWARGFWTGAQFRADVFEPLRRTPERWEAVVFIIMHMTDWDDMLPAGQSREGLAEIRRRARTIIPGAVLDLCRFWQERDGSNEAVLVSPTAMTNG